MTTIRRARGRRLTRTAAAVLTGGVLAALVGTSAASAAPIEPGRASGPSASLAAATIPTSCAGVLHRVVDGKLTRYVYRGARFQTIPVGDLVYYGEPQTPRTIALVAQTDTSDIFLSTTEDGALWRTVVNPGELFTQQIAASGWGGVRHLAGNYAGNRVYALTDSGGLYRYSLTADFRPRSLGAVSTSGWGGIAFLSPGVPDSAVDSLVGVSAGGALLEYLSNRSTGTTRGYVLKASGWSAVRHVSIGGCEESTSASMVGILSNGEAYGYLDRNAFDVSGADIASVGKIGRGFTGLLAD